MLCNIINRNGKFQAFYIQFLKIIMFFGLTINLVRDYMRDENSLSQSELKTYLCRK